MNEKELLQYVRDEKLRDFFKKHIKCWGPEMKSWVINIPSIIKNLTFQRLLSFRGLPFISE